MQNTDVKNMTNNLISGRIGLRIIIGILVLAILMPTNAIAGSSNTFDSGIMTIEEFFTGSLGEGVTATHATLSDITTLRITAGTLNNTDMIWIRTNLLNLDTFEVIESGAFESNRIPNNSFSYYGAHANLRVVNLTTVTSVGYNSFMGCPLLESVSMPLAVTIENSAFIACPNLTSVNLPEAITIEDSAFYECTSLQNISLPKATSFGYNVLMGCTSLTDISLPSLPTIGYGAFAYCTALTSVNLPNATAVDREAFFGCTALESVEMANATDIGIFAFAGCTALTTVDIPSATNLNLRAFAWCTSLTDIEMSGVISVGNGALAETAITSIHLPNATTIGSYAFMECTALESVEMTNVTSIGQGAFSGCVQLNSLTLSGTPPTVDNSYDTPDEYVFYNLPSERIVHVPDDAEDTYKAFDDGDVPASDLWYGWYVNEIPSSSVPFVTPTRSSSSGTRASVSQGQPPVTVMETVSALLRVTGGNRIEYDLSGGNTPVIGISFDAKQDKGLVVAKVQVLANSPEGVSLPASSSYQLMSIDVGSEGTISTGSADNIIIHFKVSKEWIEENSIDSSTIRMTRYSGQWQDLPTTYVREDNEYIYFSAQTPGFSIFSVVGDKIDKVASEEKTGSMEFAEESKTESTETKSTPGFTALFGIIFVSLAFYMSKKLK
jgi:PGF-pre-PGF domain-containing protein